jgi:FdhD protein
MMDTSRPLPRLAFGPGGVVPGDRRLPAEVAVALSFNGTTQAVMMATPAGLEDFALGFALTEGIATGAEIDSITVVETVGGIDVQIWLCAEAEARLANRRRTMAGPVGCGLCGIDSLAEAVRALPPVPASTLQLTPAQVLVAVAALPGGQPLHDATRAAHAAGFWVPDHGMIAVREDVGRHNALDKLAGLLARRGQDCTGGAVVLTSRLSLDLVQKCAVMGVPVMIAVSAPTTAAVALAEDCGITLIALARADRFEVFTHALRIHKDEVADVA